MSKLYKVKYVNTEIVNINYLIRIYSGIAHGRVLSGEIYTWMITEVYLCLSTGCFVA